MVVSYSPEKRFGFISSDDNESYFFHINNVADEDKDKIKKGEPVSFTEHPTPKGMAAKKVAIAQGFKVFRPLESEDIIVSRSESCGKGNEVVFNYTTISVEARSYDEAVEILKDKAARTGCNAVINLERDKRTGRAWMNKNHRYTIQQVTADIALVMQAGVTTDDAAAKANQAFVETQIASVKKGLKPRHKDISDAGPFHTICSIFGFFVFIAIVFAFLNSK